jgi:hypothetical protein
MPDTVLATVPNAARGKTTVAVPLGWSTTSWPVPSDAPEALTLVQH